MGLPQKWLRTICGRRKVLSIAWRLKGVTPKVAADYLRSPQSTFPCLETKGGYPQSGCGLFVVTAKYYSLPGDYRGLPPKWLRAIFVLPTVHSLSWRLKGVTPKVAADYLRSP